MRSSQKERREREVVHSPHEVVGQLFVVEMMVVKLAVRVPMAEGHGEDRERREKFDWQQKWWETDFLSTLDLIFSSLRL
jgi:hypothetical protein